MITDNHQGAGLFLTDMTCALPRDAWVADAAYGPIPPKPKRMKSGKSGAGR